MAKSNKRGRTNNHGGGGNLCQIDSHDGWMFVTLLTWFNFF